ncbi:MAG: tetratricopeptide repeat protein, partial [Pseudomonadota bacterium]
MKTLFKTLLFCFSVASISQSVFADGPDEARKYGIPATGPAATRTIVSDRITKLQLDFYDANTLSTYQLIFDVMYLPNNASVKMRSKDKEFTVGANKRTDGINFAADHTVFVKFDPDKAPSEQILISSVYLKSTKKVRDANNELMKSRDVSGVYNDQGKITTIRVKDDYHEKEKIIELTFDDKGGISSRESTNLTKFQKETLTRTYSAEDFVNGRIRTSLAAVSGGLHPDYIKFNHYAPNGDLILLIETVTSYDGKHTCKCEYGNTVKIMKEFMVGNKEANISDFCDEARKDITAATDYYEANKIYRQGIVDLNDKRYESALSNFKQARDKSEFIMPKTYLMLGRTYRAMGNTKEALDNLLCGVGMIAGSPEIKADAPTIASLYMEYGTTYKEAGQYEKAISQFENALRYDPENSNIYYYIAGAYRDAGNEGNNYKNAIEYFNKAIEKDPKNYRAHNELGVLKIYMNDLEGARVELETVVAAYEHNNKSVDPKLAYMSYVSLGNTWIDSKNEANTRHAIDFYESAVNLDPNSIAAYRSLYAAYTSLKDEENAKKYEAKINELKGPDKAFDFIIDANLRAYLISEGFNSNMPELIEEIILEKLKVGKTISTLRGIERLTGLKRITLNKCGFADITPLSSLMNLEFVSLRENNITDVSPLKALNKIRHLDLMHNHILDISSLTGLSNLTSLNIAYNDITDASPLGTADFSKLLDLTIGGNKITKFPSTLSNMPALSWVNIYELELQDLSWLAGGAENLGIVASYNNLQEASAFKALKEEGRVINFISLDNNPIANNPEEIKKIVKMLNTKIHLEGGLAYTPATVFISEYEQGGASYLVQNADRLMENGAKILKDVVTTE